jgi:hypothetical protein
VAVLVEDRLLSPLAKDLELLVSQTEKVYLRLGAALPEIFKELDQGLEESRLLVAYFTNGSGVSLAAASGAGVVGNVIEEAQKVIDEAAVYFNEMKESDNLRFASINRGIQNLSLLEEKLQSIREDSVEMELMSLNAMTVALKAGQAGRAFSYITEELKQLSTETISRTELLTEEGKQILDLFFGFRGTIEEIQSFQGDFYGDFREKLKGSFDNFMNGVAKMAEILMQVIDGASGSREPLNRIMEEIQQQDLIRQSIQHVSLSLDKENFKGSAASSSAEEALDELSFVALIPDLCANLLDEVESKAEHGMTVFGERLSELRERMGSAEEERAILVEYFAHSQDGADGTGSALEQMFSESIGAMSGLLTRVDSSMQEKSKLSVHGKRILDGLKGLEDKFLEFTAFVERFRSVDIAARIELAKTEVLKAKRQTMGSLTGLARKIGGDVQGALEIIRETILAMEDTIQEFAEEVERETEVVKGLSVTIRDSYQKLTSAKNYLSDSIDGFSLYSKRFLNLLDQLGKDVSRLRESRSVMTSIRGHLAVLRTRTAENRAAAMAAAGRSDWTIRSNRLRDMIERFTILTHKQTAGELGGFRVEGGSNPGDLTLF